MWITSPGTLRPFNSFLILLNPEKDLSPEQLVTIKLRNKASRVCPKLRTHNLRYQSQTRFCHFLLFLCLVGEEFCSCQLAKYYSSSLAIQAHQDLLWFAKHGSSTSLCKYSIAIWFLNDFTEENSNGKKNTNPAFRDTNADKTTVFLSHLSNNYAFIVGYCY